MAILNNGLETLISYTGDENQKLTKNVNNVSYDFYYGTIIITVLGDFNEVSINCYHHGYMGGENLLNYSDTCQAESEPESEPEPEQEPESEPENEPEPEINYPPFTGPPILIEPEPEPEDEYEQESESEPNIKYPPFAGPPILIEPEAEPEIKYPPFAGPPILIEPESEPEQEPEAEPEAEPEPESEPEQEPEAEPELEGTALQYEDSAIPLPDNGVRDSSNRPEKLFGKALAVSDNYAIILASRTRRAYIYENNSGSWDLKLSEHLSTGDGGNNDNEFGFQAVAMTDNYAIVGDHYWYGNNSPSSPSGTAYIFTRDGDTWSKQQLSFSDGNPGDKRARIVDLTDNYAIISSGSDDTTQINSGAAFIFKRNTTGGSWSEMVKLKEDPPVAGNAFGSNVAINDNNYAFIQKYTDNDNQISSVVVYKLNTNNEQWELDETIQPPSPPSGSIHSFGINISINNNYAKIGGYNVVDNDWDTVTDIAYIYKLDTDSSGSLTCTQIQTLLTPNFENVRINNNNQIITRLPSSTGFNGIAMYEKDTDNETFNLVRLFSRQEKFFKIKDLELSNNHIISSYDMPYSEHIIPYGPVFIHNIDNSTPDDSLILAESEPEPEPHPDPTYTTFIDINGTTHSVDIVGSLKRSSFTDQGIAVTDLASVSIGTNVTTIDNNGEMNWNTNTETGAFEGCTNLISINFEYASNLSSIESYAFYGCTSLTTITIPSSVTSIGLIVFYDCTDLTSVNFESGIQIKSLGNYARSGITSITIPASVLYFRDQEFQDCTSLTSVIFESGSQLRYIDRAFASNDSSGYGAPITTIVIPVSVHGIGEEAFKKCYNLTAILVPSGITYSNDAFMGANSLSNVFFYNKTDEKFYTGVKTDDNITQGSTEITATSSQTLDEMAAYFGDDAAAGKAYIASLGYTVWPDPEPEPEPEQEPEQEPEGEPEPEQEPESEPEQEPEPEAEPEPEGTALQYEDSTIPLPDNGIFEGNDGSTKETQFGNTVAVSDNYAIITAQRTRYVYIFENDSGSWVLRHSEYLERTPGSTSTGNYGIDAIAMNDNYVIVGDNQWGPSTAMYTGTAYIFKRNTTDGSWSNQQLTFSDGNQYSLTRARKVDLTDNYAIISSGSDNTTQSYSGAAYIFKRNTTDGSWSEMVKLKEDPPVAGNAFGNNVAINDNYAFIQKYTDNNNQITLVVVYKLNTNNEQWELHQTLQPPGATIKSFGTHISINDNYAIIGGYNVVNNDWGNATVIAYIYKLDTDSSGTLTFTQIQTIDFHGFINNNNQIVTNSQSNYQLFGFDGLVMYEKDTDNETFNLVRFFRKQEDFIYNNDFGLSNNYIITSYDVWTLPYAPIFIHNIDNSTPDDWLILAEPEPESEPDPDPTNTIFTDITNGTTHSVDISGSLEQSSFTDLGIAATDLASVSIGSNVISIDDSAFYGCTSLTTITIPATLKIIDRYSFYNCSSFTSINFESGSQLTSIGYQAFRNTGLTTITIPASVTNADSAFSSSTSFTSIIFESGTMKSLPSFYVCTSLTSMTIPASVLYLLSQQFMSCHSLTSVIFESGSKLRYIGSKAFAPSSSLDNGAPITTIVIPVSVYGIGHEAFHKCIYLTAILVHSGITSYGYDTFQNTDALSNVFFYHKTNEKFYTCVKTDDNITQGTTEITATSTPTLNEMAAHFGDDAAAGKAYIASLGYTVW